MHSPDAPPFNPLPTAVIVLAGTIFGIEVLFWLSKSGLLGGSAGGDEWRIMALQRFAFSGEIFDMMVEADQWPPQQVMRFLTYPFVHVSFMQMIFVVVFVLALGKMVGESFSNLAVFTVFFGASIFGALVYALVLNDPRWLVGGFPGAYGLIGAYTLILWVGYGVTGENQMRAFTLIGILMGIQLVFGLFLSSSNDWLADLAGFGAGFAIAGLAAPGSFSRLLAKLRRR